MAQYTELFEAFQDAQKDLANVIEERTYMSEFLAYKGLEDEYQYFRKNAHEVWDEEMPFPKLTL